MTGAPNKVLSVEQSDVIVATRKSPAGKPVPIEWVQEALDILEREGEVTIDVETVRYRSAFIGAVLRELPGVTELATNPPKIRLLGSSSA